MKINVTLEETTNKQKILSKIKYLYNPKIHERIKILGLSRTAWNTYTVDYNIVSRLWMFPIIFAQYMIVSTWQSFVEFIQEYKQLVLSKDYEDITWRK